MNAVVRLKIAVFCALATSICSAAIAQDSDRPYWKPGKGTLAKLDFAVRNSAEWHGTPPDFAKYDRYYAGVTVKCRRMVRADFSRVPGMPINCVPAKNANGPSTPEICIVDDSHDRPGEIHVEPEDQFPLSPKGGGCWFMTMLYDVDAGRMADFRCNAPE